MSNVFTNARALSAHELTRLAAALDGTYVFPSDAGGAVTPSSALTVAVSAITGSKVTINGTLETSAYAGGTVTATTADATNPRRDLVYYDQNGAVAIAAGTPVAVTSTTGPVPPTLTSSQIAVAELYITAGMTTIGAGDIIDRRQPAVSLVPASAGATATAAIPFVYDTTATALKVWNGSASVTIPSVAIPEILSPFMFWDASVSSSTVTANTAYLIAIPPLTKSVTITKLRLYIATSSNNLDVGIYSYDGTDLTRVVSLGSTASPGTGSRDFDIADTTLTPGTRYYFAYAPDNATISVRATQPAGTSPTIDGMMLNKATSFPLPATIAAPTKSSPISPIIYGLVSGGAVV